MRFRIIVLFVLFLINSCSLITIETNKNIFYEQFQNILSNNNVEGVILILDKQKQVFYANDFDEASKPALPASTFKIPNTIIGLETGLLKNKHTIFEWNGEQRQFSFWEKDLTAREAFQSSCIPCYQDFARKIGAERMNTYLTKLKFGDMDVNTQNIDEFWLRGNSKITPFQQIDFLERLYFEKLAISKQTNKEIKDILMIEQQPNYRLSGKTGWIASENQKDIGWFVGYVEKGEEVFFFATKIYPKQSMSTKTFLSLRKKVTLLALKELNVT